MLVGHISKESTDRARAQVSFAQWLDPGETLTSLSPAATVTIADGSTNTTPLVVSAPVLAQGGTVAVLMLDAGTPGLTYLVTFIGYGASGRLQTVEVTVAVAPASLQTAYAMPSISAPAPDLSGAVVLASGATTRRSLATRAADSCTPMDFGAFGDGASHPAAALFPSLAALQAVYPFATSLSQEMDFLGWQKALTTGGLVTCSGRPSFVMCNATVASMSPLVVIAGQAWVEGNGAILDFSAMRSQVNTTHYLPNWNFADATHWVNSADYTPGLDITLFSFGSGHATATDPPSFCRFGQQVTLQPGNYTIVVTFVATLGASYATGNVNQPYGSVGFWEFGPGDGGNWTPSQLGFPSLVDVITAGPAGITVTLKFNFNVATPWTTWPTFTGGGYANWSVTRFDIIPFDPSCAIWCTRDGSGEHYNIARPLRGLEILGNDRKNTAWVDGSEGTTAVLYESLVTQDGNMTSLVDCSIHGFGTGLWMRDGAYLTETKNTMVYDCDIGLYFSGGVNAGENMRYYGGGVFNCLWGIMNPHPFGEITFYGTALDYCYGPISNNAGKIELHGCHVENNLSDTPLFHCTSGQIMLYGGIILGVAPHIAMASVVPPVKLETSNALMTVFGTAMWDLTSGLGTFVSGVGTFRAYGWINQGNATISRPSATTIAMDPLGGVGSLEPLPAYFNGTDPTGIFLEGGIYPSVPATITNRWTTDILTVALSTAQKHSGTRSLLVTKSTGSGANYQIVFLVPVRPGQDANFSFWYQSPTQRFPSLPLASITRSGSVATASTAAPHGIPVGSNWWTFMSGAAQPEYNGAFYITVTTTTAWTYTVAGAPATPATGTLLWSGMSPLFARTWWAKQIGVDAYNRPVLSPAATFMGEVDIYLPLCGTPGWKFWSTGTQYNPPSTVAADGKAPGAPVWATHLAVTLDTESLPDWSFHLDDFTAYVI